MAWKHEQQGRDHLHNEAMFMLNDTILLMCMRARDLMRDANISKNELSFSYSPPPVRLDSNDLMINHAPNELLKLKEIFRNLRFMIE
jgi:hypothetical protein